MTIAAATPKPLPAAPAEAVPARAPPRAGRLFRKYVALFTLLIGGILIASGLVEMWFSYQENKQALAAVQREKAAAGAQRIEQFIDELRRQIGWTTRSAWSPALIEQRQIDYFQLLRQALPITEISHLDAGGREDLKVSRVGMNTIGSGADFSADPRFVEAKKHKVWFSPVYFLRDTEPYMTLAIAGAGRDGGVTVAEINLKFIWDPITRIRAGKAGYAYVVDGSGHLIAHPDLGLVLRKTDLSHLPQVAALRAPAGRANGGLIGQGIGGGEVVTAHAAIPVLGWTLFVDLPIAEAFAPVYDSLLRSGFLILVGLVLAIGASLLLSRRIVGPIQALTVGAARIGSGDLAHRIDIRTNDELQDLAVRFNAMAGGLQESYSQLERRVEERTRELSDALAYQTATSDVLKVISRSAFDLETVLATLIETAMRLCNASGAAMFRVEGDALVTVVSRRSDPSLEQVRIRRTIDRGSSIGRAAIDKRVVHLIDILGDSDVDDAVKDDMRLLGIRTVLAVPLLREDELIGVIGLNRSSVSAFAQREIDLVSVFADQAVIAIENARLVQELREALAVQTATSDVLKVISRSAFDLDRVLGTLVETAGRLCSASVVRIFRPEGDTLVWAASRESDPKFGNAFARHPISQDTVTGRAALHRRIVQVLDVLDDPEFVLKDEARANSIRTVLAVPLLRGDVLVGVMNLIRSRVEAFSQKEIDLVTVFADQAVIAIENARLVQELKDALAYQTATSDVLKVISRSTFDLDSVLGTLTETALRLCDATTARLFRHESGELLAVASSLVEPQLERAFQRRKIDRGTVAGRAAAERRAVQVLDVATDPEYVLKEESAPLNIHTVLAVPLLREGELIGAIALTRNRVDAFVQREIDLVTVFADQAVIAIENARLVQELRESLEYQTATSDVLKVISRSAFELDTVLTTLVETAKRLCSSHHAAMFRREGDILRLAAITSGFDPQAAADLAEERFVVDRTTLVGRTAIEKVTVQILDAFEDPEYDHEAARIRKNRTMLGVPLMREGSLIGVISLVRIHVEAFTRREIDLVTTFADQAVIAIENARLVQELRESLAYQTATGEVLKVISRSAFELDTVLTTLADTAARLCNAPAVRLYRRDGDELNMAASSGHDPAFQQLVTRRRIDRGSTAGRAAVEGRVVQILDVQADPEHTSKAEARVGGVRTVLAVPLMREGTLIGVISLTRTKVEAFSQKEIDLVTVFADQAVIAIENARLVQEIRAGTAALAQSVEELRALGETGRSVVATLDLGRVLDTIMDGAVELGRADAGAIFRYTRPMREFSLWRSHGLPDEYAARLGAMQIPAAQTAMGAALIEDRTRELDIEESPLLPLREATISAGFRHVLVVPLIRGKRGYGAMVLYYADRDSVPERAHDLMQTFASQSVVAIQNARLFREIAEKSRELEVASQHKSQFLANMSHELRTPMNAILGYTELMLDGLFGEVNADMKETLDRVQQNGKHLLSLINDVLDLSKIEAGRLELTFADYDANTVVQAVMAAARPLAEAKSIAIAAEVAPDLPLGWGDERRLTQVLLNFASNAVKFTDKGSVHIAARGRDGAIEFAVTDTGPGIDPKDQARIFEEFQQADNSITREKGGTGLGLAISKRIVEMHGGTISVESRLGHGATFRAIVPIRADAGEAAA